MMLSKRTLFKLSGAVFVIYSAITPGAEDPSAAKTTPAPIPVPGLILSQAAMLAPAGARNPNVAVDPNTGTVYLAWAQEVIEAALVPPLKTGKADPKLQALLVRSDDGGHHFGGPVAVNPAQDDVRSYTVRQLFKIT